jgi:hypothetical protein
MPYSSQNDLGEEITQRLPTLESTSVQPEDNGPLVLLRVRLRHGCPNIQTKTVFRVGIPVNILLSSSRKFWLRTNGIKLRAI